MGTKAPKPISTIYKGVVSDKSLKQTPNVQRIHYDLGFKNNAFERLRDIGENLVSGGELGLMDKKKFIVNSYNRQKYEQLIKYIQGDKSCAWNIDKSIGFIGGTGVGKTMAFQIMLEFMDIDNIQYLKQGKQVSFKFKIFSARQIVSDFSTGGFDAIEKYVIPNIICIDDLGTENDNAQHFGNKVNVMEHIFEERNMYKKLTHFSSNFDADTIKKKYGDRVFSRIFDTTNLLEWVGEDWRTKQK